MELTLLENIKLLFTTYWSQLLIVFALIGYFGKRHYDLANKKVEVKFSLFHNQKLTAINNFLNAYTSMENFFWQVSYFDVVERKIAPKDLDNMILPLYNVFIGSYYSLFMVLSDEELKDFEKIEEEIATVKRSLSKLYQVYQKEDKVVATNNYYDSYTRMMKKNKLTLREIGAKFKNSYNM